MNAIDQFQAIAGEMTGEFPVKTGKIFGLPALTRDRKVFACVKGETMIFRLYGEPYDRAMALPGATMFTAESGGRKMTMKQWVVIPVVQSAAWPALAVEALHSLEQGQSSGSRKRSIAR